MTLQLIETFQRSVTNTIKQTSAFIWCCNARNDFIVCDPAYQTC